MKKPMFVVNNTENNLLHKMKSRNLQNKKGLSGVIVALIMVALALVLVAIVWGVINNLVSERLNRAGSCFGNFESVTINDEFTCFDSGGNKVQFSLAIGDVEVDGILVSISSNATSKSFTITNEEKNIGNLTTFDGEENVTLPGKNSGLTYLYNWDEDKLSIPKNIKIAPVIGGEQCSTSDTLSQIDSCDLLT